MTTKGTLLAPHSSGRLFDCLDRDQFERCVLSPKRNGNFAKPSPSKVRISFQLCNEFFTKGCEKRTVHHTLFQRQLQCCERIGVSLTPLVIIEPSL